VEINASFLLAKNDNFVYYYLKIILLLGEYTMRTQFSKIALTATLGLALAFTISCSGGDDDSSPRKTVKKEKVSGVSQKGPFVSGTVKLFELDKNYERTGTSFSGRIKEDKSGSYEITNVELASPYVELEATGKYINEITNIESEGSVTLKAIADIENKDKVSINVFTHLEHGKVLSLLKKGLSFAEAKKKAFEEVLTALGIDPVSGNSENMSLQADSVLLLASVLLQVGRSESELGTLLKTLNGIDKVKEGMAQALAVYATAKNNVKSSTPSSSSSSKTQNSSSSVVEYIGGSCDAADYGTAEIGNQVWMAKNWGCYAPSSKCNNNDPANCDKYGRVYNWATARTVCPDGWHLPTNEEWKILMQFVSNCSITKLGYCVGAGKILKSKTGWKEYEGKSGGTDDFDFAALPGGHGSKNAGINVIDGYAYWWTDTEIDASNAYSWNMNYFIDDAQWVEDEKKSLISVRCVKD